MDLGKLAGFVMACLIIGSMGQAQAQTAGFTRSGEVTGIGGLLHRVNVFSMTGEDNREQMRREPGTGLRPIGAVYDARANGYGTAFLISPCHVLTNYHLVLPADRVVTFNTGSDLTFYVGAPSGEQPYTSKTRAWPVAWGGYTVNDGGRIRFRPREDWAVLKLEECLGARYGFMSLRPISAAEARILGPKLATAGFPGDHDH